MLLVEKSVWTFQIVLKFLTILTLLIFSTPSAGVDESYIAAATAGFHGYPLAQQEFLASPTGLLSKLELVSEVLHIQVCVPGSQSASDGPLSPQKLSLLRTILQRCPSSTGKLHQQQDVACRKVKKRDYNHIFNNTMVGFSPYTPLLIP